MLQGFLISSGVPADVALVTTHFFVMYYAALAVLTPPDALAAVAAAGIARAPFLKTSIHATRVAFVAFIIPFMFVYRPALLTLGTWDEITLALVFASLGIVALSAGLEGHAFRRLTLIERLAALVTGCLLVFPNWMADTLGLGMFVVLAVLQWPAARLSLAGAPKSRPSGAP
jgi:TRAP-type uncharacterized transport system fused permease subunit